MLKYFLVFILLLIPQFLFASACELSPYTGYVIPPSCSNGGTCSCEYTFLSSLPNIPSGSLSCPAPIYDEFGNWLGPSPFPTVGQMSDIPSWFWLDWLWEHQGPSGISPGACSTSSSPSSSTDIACDGWFLNGDCSCSGSTPSVYTVEVPSVETIPVMLGNGCSRGYYQAVGATSCYGAKNYPECSGAPDELQSNGICLWPDDSFEPPIPANMDASLKVVVEGNMISFVAFGSSSSLWTGPIEVFKGGVLVQSVPSSFNWLSSSVNLKCNSYEFVAPAMPLDACYSLSGRSAFYTAYEFKDKISSSSEYTVSLSGLTLPDVFEVVVPIPLPFYVQITDGVNYWGYGSGVGASSFFTDVAPSGLYTVSVYNSLWEIISTETLSLIVIRTVPQSIPSDFYIYTQDWSYLGSVGASSQYLDRFVSSVNLGLSVPIHIQFCDYTCSDVSSVAVFAGNPCPLTFQDAYYYDANYNTVPIAPLSVVDGVYTFEDYNNQNGFIMMNTLDCNLLPVVVTMQGVIPKCSVTGSGGSIKGGRYRGGVGKQRLNKKTLGGGYERQINNF